MRQLFHGVPGINAPHCLLQNFRIDISGEDLRIPLGLFQSQKILAEHRESVRLLPRRRGGAPDVPVPRVLRAVLQFWKNFLLQKNELFILPPEIRMVRREGIHQIFRLRSCWKFFHTIHKRIIRAVTLSLHITIKPSLNQNLFFV